jgi:hypothetical protein
VKLTLEDLACILQAEKSIRQVLGSVENRVVLKSKLLALDDKQMGELCVALNNLFCTCRGVRSVEFQVS